MLRLSIVVPAINEASCILSLLGDLQPLRRQGHQLILADGGSSDGTPELSSSFVDDVVTAPKGRASQMNAGARSADGDVLWFLHADTRVPEEAANAVVRACTEGSKWGRFNIRLSGRDARLRIIERMMNLRSCVTGIATGDQGIFVSSELFESVGGYPDQPLMEDIALSRALRPYGRPVCLKDPLVTSSRRWEEKGLLKTVMLMWRLRLAYALGADPAELARAYNN